MRTTPNRNIFDCIQTIIRFNKDMPFPQKPPDESTVNVSAGRYFKNQNSAIMGRKFCAPALRANPIVIPSKIPRQFWMKSTNRIMMPS